MKTILEKIFSTLEKLEVEKKDRLTHVPEGVKPFLLAYLFRKENRALVVVVRDNQKMEQWEKNLVEMGIPAAAFPSYEILPYEYESISSKIAQKRVKFLADVLADKNQVYLVAVRALLFPVSPAQRFSSFLRQLKKGEEISRDNLQNHLIESGYRRVPHVEWPGDFSFRGEVLDIFSLQYDYPVRIELFDQEIEKLRFFNPKTQTSFQDTVLEEMVILPAHDFRVVSEDFSLLKKKLASDYPPDMIRHFLDYLLQNPTDVNTLPLLYPRYSLLDFFREGGMGWIFIQDDPTQLRMAEKAFRREVKEMYYSGFNIQKIKAQPGDYLMKLEDFSLETASREWLGLEENQEAFSLAQVFSSVPAYRGRLELFKNHLEEWKGYDLVIGCAYEGQRERIANIFPHIPTLVCESLENGFIDHLQRAGLILEQEIFGKKYLAGKRGNLFLSSSPIENFSDLDRGDFVVHVQHGIGCYQGLEKLSVLGKQKDYIRIAYAEDEKLYVPVEQIFLIHKYLGASEGEAKLDRLGGKSWKKKNERVRQKMEEIAKELALLYEKRKHLQGFAYPEDSPWQYEFEAGFSYKETLDQIKAIEDVKRDMESAQPMDRLVCGDVGYGKTEVAMRAVFKAVSSGKQAAVLVPTTLLAEQHYQTFLERFENFPLTIKMLSRLVPASQEKKVLQGLAEGSVDIVVGTHKILEERVKFKNLGLLVVDEEQRFGVRHKERVKQIKSSIDVLTLSATPIPRTLYMGLSKLRDISLITTPPVSRMPIKTHVMPFNNQVLRMAIEREKERKGQVFIIHNRVKTINSFAQFVQRLVPGVRIAVGHAKLPPAVMEEIFMDFIHGNYDILISTTIVENGIDIPNANTIIIDRPELLGLSELYQLRGRVGRGDRQGYAYLFYDPVMGITADVQKRLEVIEEYTELGSGFKIAMKDLEIRGAGNVLGRDQSGFIADVGMEFYAQMMEKAVAQVKGSIREEEIEPLIDLSFNGYIPEEYIFEEKERFSIYKIIMRAREMEEVEQLRFQIEDRYGKIPQSVENLIQVSGLKVWCKKLGIREFREEKENYLLDFVHNLNIRPEVLVRWMQEGRGRIMGGQRFALSKQKISHPNPLEAIREFFSELEKKEV